MKAMTKEPKTQAAAKPTAPKTNAKKAEASVARAVLYETVITKTCRRLVGPDGNTGVELYDERNRPPLSVTNAKKLLQWETESEYKTRMKLDEVDDPFQKDFLLRDHDGQKVRCDANIGNRPLDMGWVAHLEQDVLNRRWRFNGEALIVGKTGIIMSGQHRLIALVLAGQTWAKRAPGTPWKELWTEEPYLETVVTFGVDESQDVKVTLDEVKARTTADSFYTSELFDGKAPGEKKDLCRYLDHAIALLWKRTGAGDTAMIEKLMTHSSAMGFLERHPRLKKAVLHIFDQNKDKAITMLRLYCGHAAAMMYLMGASATDGDVYRNVDPAPHEKKIDWATWEKAREFWNLIGAKSKQLDPLYFALGQVVADEDGGGKTEMIGVVAKAWAAYAEGKPLIADELRLATTFNADKQCKELAEFPDFGGIDLGPGIKGRAEAVDPAAPANVPATAEEIKKQQAEEAVKVVEEAKRKKSAIPLSDAELLAKRKEQAAKIEAARKATGGKPAPMKAPVPKPNPPQPKAAANGKAAAKKPAVAPAAK